MEFLIDLSYKVLTGDTLNVIGFLAFIIMVQWVFMFRQNKQLQTKDEKLFKIVDDLNERDFANRTAFNKITDVLISITTTQKEK